MTSENESQLHIRYHLYSEDKDIIKDGSHQDCPQSATEAGMLRPNSILTCIHDTKMSAGVPS